MSTDALAGRFSVKKLSPAKVVRMRRLFRSGATYQQLALLMQVSHTCVANAVHGRTWKAIRGAVARPERSSATRLGVDAIRDIRRRYDEGRDRLSDIAHEYRISATAVSRIGRRVSRREVAESAGGRGPEPLPAKRVGAGERCHLAKLSSREVQILRRLATALGTGHYRTIAQAFDTSRSNVSMIANGRRWRDLHVEAASAADRRAS